MNEPAKHDAADPSDESSRPCPICKKQVAEDEPTFPFCSKRCRNVDLGHWFNGAYCSSRPLEVTDEEDI